MPRIYGYARVSFLDDEKQQSKNAISIDTQQARVSHYIDYQRSIGGALAGAELATVGWRGVRQQGEATDDGFFVDQDVSAYKKPLLTRPAGRRLSAALELGDHVIFARLDRAFRNVRDALTTIEIWHRRNIGVHFLDPQVDLSTAHGRAFLQMSAVWAEFSSALHSERMREVNAQAKRQGRALNGRHQYGWSKNPNAITPQPDYEERAVMAHILWLRDERNLSWRKISDAIERTLAEREGRRPIPPYEGGGARRYGHMRCLRGYNAAKELNIQPADSF